MKVVIYKNEALYALKKDKRSSGFFTKRTNAARFFKCDKKDLVCIMLPNVLHDRIIDSSEINKLKSNIKS